LIDGPALLEVWDRMFLPRHVRAAWLPLIDGPPTAAGPVPLDPLQDQIVRVAAELPRRGRWLSPAP
jgi:hypothetical protein